MDTHLFFHLKPVSVLPQGTASLSSKYTLTYIVNHVYCVMPTNNLVLAEFHHVKQMDPSKEVFYQLKSSVYTIL